jgi:DNA invertase Pin-like site-specific DNA recombinase
MIYFLHMNYIAYYRTSTRKQDYGIEAQKNDVARYLKSVGGELMASFEEKESGRDNKREALEKAIAMCKATKSRLIIAKLCRLSRNAHFVMSLQESNLDFVCCDMPNVDKFTIGILALVAQKEAERISINTRAGLQVARERGVKLGSPSILQARIIGLNVIKERKQAFAESSIKTIREIQSTGVKSLNRISQYLNLRGVRGARGGAWTAASVKRVLQCVS